MNGTVSPREREMEVNGRERKRERESDRTSKGLILSRPIFE